MFNLFADCQKKSSAVKNVFILKRQMRLTLYVCFSNQLSAKSGAYTKSVSKLLLTVDKLIKNSFS